MKKSSRSVYALLYLSLYSCYLIFQFRSTEKTIYNEAQDAMNVVSLGMFIIILCSHIINKDSIYQITLGIMYILYTVNDIVNTCSIEEYKQSRTIMWLVTSPLMIQQYLSLHSISWWDIKLHFHVVAQILYCFQSYRRILFYPALVLELYFFIQFFKYHHLPQTKLCLQVWFIFSVVIVMEHYEFINMYHSPVIFKMLDIMGKGVWLLNMSEPKLTEIIPKDIHSLRLMGGIQQFIGEFTRDNDLEGESLQHIEHLKKLILKDIQIDTTSICANLLELILPYGLDKQYLLNTNQSKKYDEVVVLMTDIVGYTGLALTNDASKIYSMLHQLYLTFDSKLNNRKCIQKIETIGDAYMAVGDLSGRYCVEHVISNMLELAHIFLKDVEIISASSSIPICIRIGISLGPVVIGTLGKMIPRMCVVGHTVNLASRLQSSTDTQTIQVCTNFFDKIPSSELSLYHYEKRENVDLKHIGKMNTVVFKT